MINRRRFIGSTLAAGIAAVTAVRTRPSVAFAAPGDRIEDLKATALDYLNQQAPGIPVGRIDFTGMSGDYATIRLFPTRPDLTDPATVILFRENGVWTGFTYGTSFYDLVEDGVIPGNLFDEEYIYTFPRVFEAIDRIPGRPLTYNGNGFIFQYPPDGQVDAAARSVSLQGPMVGDYEFQMPAYEIRISPVQNIGDTPLDEWGFRRMQREIANRIDQGVLVPEPVLVRAYSTYDPETFDPVNKVFQYDWFAGDSYDRTILLAPVSGGQVVSIRSRVYPPENHPGAEQAESALSLLVTSLRIGQG